MRNIRLKARTVFALGISNVFAVAWYRLSLKTGVNRAQRLIVNYPRGPFFHFPDELAEERAQPREGWYQYAEAFGRRLFALQEAPPPWLSNCINGVQIRHANLPWSKIPDFDPEVGDIKTVWEFSRFDWVLSCAQRAAKGDKAAVHRLNVWLSDWIYKNPPYQGPNWKCGQEVAIRVMHLAMAAKILGQVRYGDENLLCLIDIHLQRIAPTVRYAMAQDNNHGTSEAAALFIGGTWLQANGREQARKFTSLGRKWLENRVCRLIDSDGSFSQYSLNYHRVVLDTLSMAEVWRSELRLPKFSKEWYRRAAAASDWLRTLINPENGYGPNLGANDGARLLPLTDASYRDYRPSVQLASVLFHDACAFEGDGIWNQPIYWLGLSLPEKKMQEPSSAQFDGGGYFVLRRKSVMAMLRYPNFHFRPNQADALHMDLWVAGENELGDAGSFSYSVDRELHEYFTGTVAHNTIQFDNRDQMPRLSRFLFGAWIRTKGLVPLTEIGNEQRCAAGYRDWKGAEHYRSVALSDDELTVEDCVHGFEKRAVLRWRLKPGEWVLDDDAHLVHLNGMSISVSADAPIQRLELVTGWQSNYYLHKIRVPVLEIEVERPCKLTTRIVWAKN